MTMRSQTPWFLFDSSDDATGGHAIILENPTAIVRADTLSEVPAAIVELERFLERGLYAAGFFSYELGYALEPSLHQLMPEDRQVPLLWFALYPSRSVQKGAQLTSFLERRGAGLKAADVGNLRPSIDKGAYLRHFRQVKQLIASGDIYQVNLAFKLLFEHEGDPFALYEKLRARQPVPYGAFLQTEGFSVLSLSPELFFEVKGRQIFSRPMKGTIRRGLTQSEDEALCLELQNDPKNRAENLMIVDLMRNDFARICELGSVEVSDLYRVNPFPTLYQMTSGVKGRLRDGLSLDELIRALLPAGSITGAPKIRAQQVVNQLEEGARGLYCGAIGMLCRNPVHGELSALFNVAIRTLTLFPDGRGEVGIGSGIVQDSEGEGEYEECLLKARFLSRPDFQLIETMRLDADGRYYLLQRHLDRLMRSCRDLDFLCPLKDIKRSLEKKARSLEGDCYRVRLLLDTGGRFEIAATRIDKPDAKQVIRFVVSSKRVSAGDSLLAHKTTRRELFDEEWSSANKKHGTGEVLFLNERGELTEGARSNLFIEHDGSLITPPLSCGLLPGTLREQLMSEGRVVERVLRLEDLANAKIYFGNSVRGLQPAKMCR